VLYLKSRGLVSFPLRARHFSRNAISRLSKPISGAVLSDGIWDNPQGSLGQLISMLARLNLMGKDRVQLLPMGLVVAIPSAIEVSGDIIAAATTLAGLILVFLGATSTSYESYDPVMRDRKIRARFSRRAWFGFVGFSLSLLTVIFALIAKWLHQEWAALVSLILFMVALVWVLIAALMSVRDIK
jgi:hypothetical protein